MRTLPFRKMDDRSGKRHPAFSTWLDNEEYSDYWRGTAVDEHFAQYTVPILQVCGWYDLYAGGMMDNFVGLEEHAGTEQARTINASSWGRGPIHRRGTRLRARPMPVIAISGCSRSSIPGHRLAWFDHWLKGVPNDAEKATPLKIFVMGANYWRDEQEWPLARTEWTAWYLRSGGNANTLRVMAG